MDEIREVGVSHFHFSLNWSALVPTGDVAHPNTTLLGYYRCFTRQLLQANVTPVVTLWHHTHQRSSLPAPLDTTNKWLNRSDSGFMNLLWRLHVKMDDMDAFASVRYIERKAETDISALCDVTKG